ncbi:hypothetical protein DPX16_17198 [Anabarilius grahami]|uniref:Uncharacterized protein n=1 Tax=Anabarilius grahami TaxID=495550 RepID=A0A3N0YAZ2_ANAGA|nr:hypothetical protein DPX16_17198 [Anabarilius grahami]
MVIAITDNADDSGTTGLEDAKTTGLEDTETTGLAVLGSVLGQAPLPLELEAHSLCLGEGSSSTTPTVYNEPLVPLAQSRRTIKERDTQV